MNQEHSSETLNVPTLKNQLILTAAGGILLIAAAFIFGAYVLAIAAVSYAVSIIIELAFAKFRKKKLDIGWMVTPMLFALIVPPTLPLWMVGVGAGFGVFFGKAIFGGTGKTIFNPAIVGVLFLIVSFPIHMTQTWVNPSNPDIAAGPTPLNALNRGIDSGFDIQDLLFGFNSGTLGETFRLGILILGILLIVLKVINWKVPVFYLGTVFAVNLVGQWLNPDLFRDPLLNLLTGGLMLGAFFFASDPQTTPLSTRGMIFYGIGLGLLTVIIRVYATFPEGVTFSIILMNAISPLLDPRKKDEEKLEEVSA